MCVCVCVCVCGEGVGCVRLQKRNQRISETTRLQSSARAVINRRAPKSYRSARASIFSACACHTARSSTFSACALWCYTDISIRFNKETKERVYQWKCSSIYGRADRARLLNIYSMKIYSSSFKGVSTEEEYNFTEVRG